jgi:hypothetical protein
MHFNTYSCNIDLIDVIVPLLYSEHLPRLYGWPPTLVCVTYFFLIRTGHFIILTYTLTLDTQHGMPKADHTTHAKIKQ